MGGTGTSPCASCKLLRRRCAKECVFAPYFPAEDPHKFAIVHKVFGASNVSKMLQDLPIHQRADTVSSLVYEANAVNGCVGAISYLQHQVSQLQMQLAVAQAEILCIQMQQNDLPQNNSSFAQKEINEKSIFMQNGMNNNGLVPQLMNNVNFCPSGGNGNVGFLPRENLKRESLWT